MTETFAALLFAHVLADFVFQTRRMAETKRRPGMLVLHAAIVYLTAVATLGRVNAWEPAGLALAHAGIDALKAFALPRRLWAFLLDQGLHLASVAAIATISPDLFPGGHLSGVAALPGLMALLAGLVVATTAGGHAVALLVKPWDGTDLPEGLPDGGRLIGLLERGIIFLLILVGQPAGIGFLIAAKSVLRFETTSKDQRAGEYVIVGTLASFGWGMLAGWATLALLARLPPLGFLPANP